MMPFDFSDWFWIVDGDPSRLWSSAAAGFVTADDPDYLSWAARSGGPTSIGSLNDLAGLFARHFPAGMLSTYAAAKRYIVETGGIVVSGVAVATDDRSKTMLLGARVKADADVDFTTEWKTPDGFLSIDAITIVAISDAVLAHVDACFATEASVLSAIEAGTISSIAEIDAAGWPATIGNFSGP